MCDAIFSLLSKTTWQEDPAAQVPLRLFITVNRDCIMYGALRRTPTDHKINLKEKGSKDVHNPLIQIVDVDNMFTGRSFKVDDWVLRHNGEENAFTPYVKCQSANLCQH